MPGTSVTDLRQTPGERPTPPAFAGDLPAARPGGASRSGSPAARPVRLAVAAWGVAGVGVAGVVFASALGSAPSPIPPAAAIVGAWASIWAGGLIHGRRALLLASLPGYFGLGLMLTGRPTAFHAALGASFLACLAWNVAALLSPAGGRQGGAVR